jgi:hypothetical protein
LGLQILRGANAATTAIAVQPEAGALTEPATVLSDAPASGGQAVRFGPEPTLPIPPTPVITPNTIPAPGQVGFRGAESSLMTASTTTPPPGLRYNSGSGYFESATNTTRTYDGYKFTRPVNFSSSLPVNAGVTVTFKNSIFEVPGNQPYGGFTYQGGFGTTKIIIQDSTFRASSPLTGLYGNGQIHTDVATTALRNDISGRSDGVQNGSGSSTYEQNYIHTPGIFGTYPNNTHNDGMQFYSGSNIVIRFNRIDIGWNGIHHNGALFFQGSFSGPVIHNNFLSGGGFTLRLEPGVNGAVVTSNVFKLPAINNPPWGPFTHSVGGNTASWSGNTLSPNGTVVNR